MIILNQQQIKQKIKRMAMEIYERHANEKQIYFAGINKKGYVIAQLLEKELSQLCELKCTLINLSINPAAPNEHPIEINIDKVQLKNKVVIITDDVSNTGRTLFYSFRVLMDIIPKKVEVAVLIERTHKCFPIHVTLVGMRLATTIKENIEVNLDKGKEWMVSLE